MVLCQELSAADYGAGGQPAADLERKFYGLWTFEPVRNRRISDRAYSLQPRTTANLNCPSAEIAAAAPALNRMTWVLLSPASWIISKPANWMTAS